MTSKSVPMRTCVGCRQVKEKKELIRIVRTPQGRVFVDPAGCANGRGAYLCADPNCLQKAVRRKGFARSLSCEIPREDYRLLMLQLEEMAQDRASLEKGPDGLADENLRSRRD